MKTSLAKINFYNILFTAFIFTISIALFEIYSSYSNFEKQVQRMQERYILVKKQISQEQVNKMVKQIQENIDNRFEILEKTLAQNVDEYLFLYKNLQSKNTNLNENEILQLFIKEIESYQLPNSSTYYYLFDENTTLLYHGLDKKLIGINVIEHKEEKDILGFIKKSVKDGYATGLYKWINPKTKTIEKKFAYIKKIPNTKIYLATGFYIEEMKEDIKEDIKNIINESRFGLDSKGYFWIHSLSGEMIVHPIQSELNGTNIYAYKTSKNRFPFREMNKIINDKGYGFIDYFWEYPFENGNEEKKVSYVKKLGYFDWVIGSGFYFRDQVKAAKLEEQYLKDELEDSLVILFFILVLVFSISVLVAYYVSKRINKILEEKKSYFSMLEQYKIVLDKSSIVSKTDKDGFITYVNTKFEQISGYTSKELIGQTHHIVRHKSTPKEIFSNMWKKISNGQVWAGIIKNKKKDGTSYYNSITILPIKNEHNNIIEYISVSTDITEISTKNDFIENITLTDGLTGLGSRVKLTKDLLKYKNSTLAIIDILNFNGLNDIYGQKIGDKIINEVGHEIFEFIKTDGTKVYRLYADVFAVLCVDNNTNEFILQINKLISYLNNFYFYKSIVNSTFDFVCGISYGNDNLLACADIALKEAKSKKLTVNIYNKNNSKKEEYKNNIKWMEIVSKALLEDRIMPYFQPIYSYKDKSIKQYESLMRLIDESGNIVTPMNFLDIIKHTSIYPKLTQTMIRKTIDEFRYTLATSFSINITLEDLLNKETMQYFYSSVSSADIFERLIIEIVDVEELINFEKVGEILFDFKARGTKIAIDNFGIGYLNYDYLLKLNVDYIKVDRSLVNNITDIKTIEKITEICDFAQKNNIQTIAKFVSDSKIDKSIEKLNIDFAQGYFYGKPSSHIEIL